MATKKVSSYILMCAFFSWTCKEHENSLPEEMAYTVYPMKEDKGFFLLQIILFEIGNFIPKTLVNKVGDTER